MTRWFRYYDGALDDPKVQRLSPPVFKGWVNLLCLASRDGGKLPSLSNIAFALRVTEHEADTLIQALLTAGLIDDVKGQMMPHNWNARQYEDRTNALRQQRFRDKRKADNVTQERNGRNAVTVTTRTDTDTEQNREEMRAKARALIPLKMVFPRDGTIEFTAWADIARKSCPGTDVDSLSNRFRGWCMERGIEFDASGIEKTFATFCQKSKTRSFG
jgi:hypothetical protein